MLESEMHPTSSRAGRPVFSTDSRIPVTDICPHQIFSFLELSSSTSVYPSISGKEAERRGKEGSAVFFRFSISLTYIAIDISRGLHNALSMNLIAILLNFIILFWKILMFFQCFFALEIQNIRIIFAKARQNSDVNFVVKFLSILGDRRKRLKNFMLFLLFSLRVTASLSVSHCRACIHVLLYPLLFYSWWRSTGLDCRGEYFGTLSR